MPVAAAWNALRSNEAGGDPFDDPVDDPVDEPVEVCDWPSWNDAGGAPP